MIPKMVYSSATRLLVVVYCLDGGEEGFGMDQIKDAIPSDLFRGRTDIVRVEICSSSVKRIEAFAFEGCTELREISLCGVRDIHRDAFYGCDKLERVIVEDDIVNIDLLGYYGARYFREVKPYPELINAMQAGCYIELHDKDWVDPHFWD